MSIESNFTITLALFTTLNWKPLYLGSNKLTSGFKNENDAENIVRFWANYTIMTRNRQCFFFQWFLINIGYQT